MALRDSEHHNDALQNMMASSVYVIVPNIQ